MLSSPSICCAPRLGFSVYPYLSAVGRCCGRCTAPQAHTEACVHQHLFMFHPVLHCSSTLMHTSLTV